MKKFSESYAVTVLSVFTEHFFIQFPTIATCSSYFSKCKSAWSRSLIVRDVVSLKVMGGGVNFENLPTRIGVMIWRVRLNWCFICFRFLIFLFFNNLPIYLSTYDPLLFSDISERNNDYSDTLDFRRSEWGRWGWSRFSFWRSLITNPPC